MRVQTVMPDPKPRALAAAFLVAGSLVLVQVSFSRLIGYKLFHHFVFLAISLSLLGLGAAGTWVAIRMRPSNEDRSLERWLAALIVSVPVAFLLIANPFGVTQHPPIRIKLLGTDAITYLLWCSPLVVWLDFCGGVVLTTLFSRYSHRMGRLHAAGLVGAGAGSLLCVALMKYGSPPVAFVSATGVSGLALLAYNRALEPDDAAKRFGVAAGALAACLVAVIFLGPASLRNFENFPTAGEARALPPVIKYEWNHLIRTDHVPGWYRLDGEAAARIVAWTPKEQRKGITKPAYAIAPRSPVVGIIGVGGGRQLAEARRAAASHITAIDIDASILRWVQTVDRGRTRDLFIDPSIELELGDGRHVVRSSKRKFDVLVMHAIDTYAATASGSYALRDDFLYTEEAIEDYYHALTGEGVLTISRWLFYPPRENLRLFGTVLDALRDLGLAEPRDHVAMIAPVPDYTKLGERRVWGYLLVSKPPLEGERLAKLRAHVKRHDWSFLYAPDERAGTYFDERAHTSDRAAFQRDYPYLVSTVTDANPYPFQLYDPLSGTAHRQSSDPATTRTYQRPAVALLFTLAIAIVLSFATIIAPLLWVKRKTAWAGGSDLPAIGSRHGLYFAAVGVGYAALAVPIIQLLSLYLGHPAYGLSVVLVALLISSGLGSLLVDRLDPAPWTVCGRIAIGVAVLTIGILPLVHRTLDLADPARFAVALLLVLAYGLPMGIPLVLGVRRLGREGARSVAWAWGIHAVAAVIGSCVATIAMVFAGSHVALAGAAICYGIASVAARVWAAPHDLVGMDVEPLGSVP